MPYLQTENVEIFYQDLNSNADGPAVLLITGLGGVGDGWGPFIPFITSERRVIIPDHRGCGRSTHTLEGLTLSQLSSDFANLIRHLKCGPVHVIGSSTGGAIGQRMAIEHADTVRSLVNVDSWGRSDEYFRQWFCIRQNVLLGDTWENHINLSQLLLYSPAYWRQNTTARQTQRAAMMFDGGSNKYIDSARMDMIMAHDAIAALAKVEIPMLAVTGSADIICPPYMGKELAAAVKGGEFELIVDCGHYSHEEKPDDLYHLVDKFLRKHGN